MKVLFDFLIKKKKTNFLGLGILVTPGKHVRENAKNVLVVSANYFSLVIYESLLRILNCTAIIISLEKLHSYKTFSSKQNNLGPPCTMSMCTVNLLVFIKDNFAIAKLFFKNFLEDISPFRGATDTLVLDFWQCHPWVSKPGWIPHLCALLPTCNEFPRFTSGVTPANCIEVSMAAEPFRSTYLQMCLQALVEVRGLNLWLSMLQAWCFRPLGHSGSAS